MLWRRNSRVRCVFGKCYRTENGLVPDEDGGSVALEKAKFSTYDIYFGITQSSMVITECEKGSYFYEFNDEPNVRGMDIQEVEAEIFLRISEHAFLWQIFRAAVWPGVGWVL